MYNAIIIDNRRSSDPYHTFFISKDLRTAMCYFSKTDSERFDFKNKKDAEQAAKDYIKLNNLILSENLQIKVVKNKEVQKWVIK